MIEELLNHQETQQFLSDYPKSKWPVCVEAVFIYGLNCLKRDFPLGLSIPELMKLAGKVPKSALSSIPTNPYPTNSLSTPPKTISIPESSQNPIISSTMHLKSSHLKSPSMKDSFSRASSKSTKNYSGTKPLKAFSSSITEPEICSIKNASEILKVQSQELIIPSNSKSSDFETHLQKRGLRKLVFPVLDIKLDGCDSLNSTFSLPSTKY